MELSGVPPAPTIAGYRFGQIPLPNPRSGGGGGAHRRAISETFLRLPDFGISDIDFPSLPDDNVSGGGDAALPKEPTVPDHAAAPAGRPVSGAHHRSLSMDTALFEEMEFQSGGGGGEAQEIKRRHRRSGSMDGTISPFGGESVPPLSDYAKKAITADKLAELALIDPRRAKRILANRQSAARSKERKIRHTSELERKVQTLQTEATTLSAQLTVLQRDTTDLTTENRELKLRLQAMEQQAQLCDALNEALREEVQCLKMATRQLQNTNGNSYNGGLQHPVSNYYSTPHQLPPLSGRQPQSLYPSQIQSSSNGQSLNAYSPNDPMDFM
ncbi:transcription factor VIP1 [Canna indica]|uniref:Transcription factor VIP1 n=1 Tax=Canna indica TaxID=4628 RepID=A0AAQ3KP47_9LILI|nr:transcription factor VIP1 [Canna indica]